MQELRARIGGADLRYAAPPALRARIGRALAAAGAPRPFLARLRPAWPVWSLGGGGAALLASLAILLLVPRGPDLSAELVASHVRSLQAAHLLDVATSDQHTVKPWFAGRVDFSPPVIDTSAAGFTLVGGRLDYLDGRPVAAIVYRRRLHLINLFVWPESGTGGGDESARRLQSAALARQRHGACRGFGSQPGRARPVRGFDRGGGRPLRPGGSGERPT